ncbi:hypothetical protein J6590_066356 [Homalodisca vitripennis]|nr:hypothetical protein J6590_066356 [Homalodisca vitripennis]
MSSLELCLNYLEDVSIFDRLCHRSFCKGPAILKTDHYIYYNREISSFVTVFVLRISPDGRRNDCSRRTIGPQRHRWQSVTHIRVPSLMATRVPNVLVQDFNAKNSITPLVSVTALRSTRGAVRQPKVSAYLSEGRSSTSNMGSRGLMAHGVLFLVRFRRRLMSL